MLIAYLNNSYMQISLLVLSFFSEYFLLQNQSLLGISLLKDKEYKDVFLASF